MAKVDCNVAVNFLREIERMCDTYGDGHTCQECPLSSKNNDKCCHCDDLMRNFPDRAIEIVQKWSDEHPQKTRLEDLLEMFPDTPLREDGLLDFLPTLLGYCKDCRSCRCFEKICSEVCWNEPVDGGATGKEVE